MISFGTDVPEALERLTEVLERLSKFGLQLEHIHADGGGFLGTHRGSSWFRL